MRWFCLVLVAGMIWLKVRVGRFQLTRVTTTHNTMASLSGVKQKTLADLPRIAACVIRCAAQGIRVGKISVARFTAVKVPASAIPNAPP